MSLRPSPPPLPSGLRRGALCGLAAVLVAAVATAGVAVATVAAPAGAAAGTPLVGTFHLAVGAQKSSGATVTGSYFRMLQPGGTVAAGPYLANADSSLPDQTYTPFTPGTDGGLTTGTVQAEPKPAFDSSGNSLAARIIEPTPFFGVKFSVDTNAKDRQTGTATTAPTVSVDGSGHLSADLSGFDASWNNQEFNQGSPKPDGSHPGVTADPTGTYDAVTGAYTLNWASQIVGGPFNNFTGVWHFTGTFTKAAGAPTVTGVSPASGPAAGGNAVTVTGSGLGGATAVTFGGTAGRIIADSATSVTAVAPKGAGAVAVSVTTPGGTASSSAGAYTYGTGVTGPTNPLTALLAALLPPPSRTGGIGSVVPVLGVFGPFTSEAVSFLPVINALTPAISPLLPTFGTGVDALQPVLNVLVPVLNDLEQKGYDAIAPVYRPYRQQILLAENRLAKALAPFVSQVVNLPTLPYLQSIEGIVADKLGAAAAGGHLPSS